MTPPLFADPSSTAARQAFAHKPRALTDKVCTVAEAVSRLVNDGDYFASGGFGSNRIPTAVVHEILRQRKQNLRFAGHTTRTGWPCSAAVQLNLRSNWPLSRKARRRPEW